MFGEALRYELIQIEGISNKVFPIVAPKETPEPFLVYRRQNIELKKTLSGTSNKVHAIYELVLVTKKYDDKETIETRIIEKLLDFYGRNIGETGPFIQNITAELLNEAYEPEVDLITSTIKIEVDY